MVNDINSEANSLLGRLVFPIVISTPFAVGDVQSYLILDEKIVLVDCGQQSDSALEQLQAALKEHDLQVEDLDEIWLTHGHPDHFGQAARLAETSGAVVKGHPKERSNFAGNSDRAQFRDFFEGHRTPADIIDLMLGQLDWLQQYPLRQSTPEPPAPDCFSAAMCCWSISAPMRLSILTRTVGSATEVYCSIRKP